MTEKWTIKQIDLSLERQIAMAAVVSTSFIKEILPAYNPEFMQSDYCKLIVHWSLEYFSAYDTAPDVHIKDIYERKRRERQLDIETSRSIGEFLGELSEQYVQMGESFNYKMIVDSAILYFKERAITLHLDTVKALHEAGEFLQAEVAIKKYREPVKLLYKMYDVFDPELIRESLTEPDDDDDDVLFQLPGDLGKLIGPFCRDDFVAVAGPMGRGKTWALQYVATEALYSGLDVAFFSMGDMSVKQMTQRFHRSFVGLPRKSGKFYLPVWDCDKNQTGSCRLEGRLGAGTIYEKGEPKDYFDVKEWTVCDICRGERIYKPAPWLVEEEITNILTYQRAKRKSRALRTMTKGRIMLAAWPRKMGGISDIRAMLELWRLQYNFFPSVIITDYADIMRDESRSSEHRHQLNYLWEAHDSLAKETHTLVVSATQTSRATYSGKTNVEGEYVADDIRKLAHVSTMFALNQTARDKRHRLMRVSLIKSRHDEFDPERQCFVLQNLDCGQFCVDSYIE